jgi:hypothetical protein
MRMPFPKKQSLNNSQCCIHEGEYSNDSQYCILKPILEPVSW